MIRVAIVLACLLAGAAASAGCGSKGRLEHSTLESSAHQLDAAERSGYPSEIIVVDEEVEPAEAIARVAPVDAFTTYLVLTRSNAQIVWSRTLAQKPPARDRAIVGRWVLPFLRAEDLDGALKAFVFGYLNALHEADLIEWDEAIVPFLPAGAGQRKESSGGLVLAFLVALLVGRASAELS